MHTAYYLKSAQEVSIDLLDSIKATFKSKSITITVRESDCDQELTDEVKAILDELLMEDESTYMSGEDFLKELKEKYKL